MTYHRIRFTALVSEKLESRHCLSGLGFVPQPIDCCSPNGIRLVGVEDIDGDGDTDAFAIGPNAFYWYENEGVAGRFETVHATVAPGIDSYWFSTVNLVDFDGDGDIDVINSVSHEAGIISWYENLGGRGIFGEKQLLLQTESTMMGPSFTDLDSDGDVDVIVGAFDYSNGNRHIILNLHENSEGRGELSDGAMLVSINILRDEYLQYIQLADVDGDAKDELFVGTSNSLYWFGRTEANGASERFMQIDSVPGNVNRIDAVDVDRDGDLDLIVSSADGGGMVWLENMDGQGQFNTHLIDAALQTNSFSPTDLDGDGDLDLLVSSRYFRSGGISWFENEDGKGSFGEQQLISNSHENQRIAVLPADVDQDGAIDIVASTEGTLFWQRNIGNGAFLPSQRLTSATRNVRLLQTADLDGDGDLDTLAAVVDGIGDTSTSNVVWYENLDGQGKSGRQQMLASTPGWIRTFYVDDIDGDRDLDIVWTVEALGPALTATVSWFENTNGRGTFGPEMVIDAHDFASFTNLELGDFDGDGSVDLLTERFVHSGDGVSGLILYRNDIGGPDFEPEETDGGTFKSVGDLDNDGDLDIIELDPRCGTWWRENDGQGSFGASQVISSCDIGSITHHLADINGDGTLDLVLQLDSEIVLLENDVDGGRFGNRRTVFEGRIATLEVADIDTDGDLDILLVGNNTEGTITWLENSDGKGRFVADVFTPPHRGFNSLNLTAIHAVDFDNDADTDLIVSSDLDGSITWLENRLIGDSNNDGVFNSSDLVTVFQSGKYEDDMINNATFEEGDWNGDGEFDSSDFVFAFQAGKYSEA